MTFFDEDWTDVPDFKASDVAPHTSSFDAEMDFFGTEMDFLLFVIGWGVLICLVGWMCRIGHWAKWVAVLVFLSVALFWLMVVLDQVEIIDVIHRKRGIRDGVETPIQWVGLLFALGLWPVTWLGVPFALRQTIISKFRHQAASQKATNFIVLLFFSAAWIWLGATCLEYSYLFADENLDKIRWRRADDLEFWLGLKSRWRW